MPTKRCELCDQLFERKANLSRKQWAERRFCSAVCANADRARQQSAYSGDWGVGETTRQRINYRHRVRSQAPAWAKRWEARRHREDLVDIANEPPPRAPCCSVKDRPKQRALLVGGTCPACGDAWLDYAGRKPSGYCTPCNEARWKARNRHTRRMRTALAAEPISSEVVFKRDGYRCQLCGEPTEGVYPHPRSPSLDHIIPLSRGGEHTYANTQCACWICNVLKGDRIPHEQAMSGEGSAVPHKVLQTAEWLTARVTT